MTTKDKLDLLFKMIRILKNNNLPHRELLREYIRLAKLEEVELF